MPARGLIRHTNMGYDPYATRYDTRVRCAVCGFAGIDPERTNEPEQAPGTIVTTGTTWHPGSGGDWQTDIDLVVYTDVPAYGACPFCGSPRWRDGSASDLHW